MKRISILLPLFAGGCVGTATSIVKAPFQVAGKAVDWSTTSQEESDRNYGRKMRKAEAREGKERREYEKRCRKEGAECRGYDGYVARD
ncbi:hypothetical protein [Sphingomonas sp.]|uniref:hypothetical protein n=1 Tax=Sphingomonas sp. TaxID=28214 RepID=UPI0035BBB84D